MKKYLEKYKKFIGKTCIYYPKYFDGPFIIKFTRLDKVEDECYIHFIIMKGDYMYVNKNDKYNWRVDRLEDGSKKFRVLKKDEIMMEML